MCLILFAYKVHPDYPLIVAANRDESYLRATTSAEYWSDHPRVLAGRDQELGGTWLGLNKQGRFAAVTNYREGVARQTQQLSRGALTADYLCTTNDTQDHLRLLAQRDKLYAGYNLLLNDGRDMFYYSNRQAGMQKLQPGYYGLANHLLNTDWPKVTKGKAALQTIVNQQPTTGALLDLLTDTTQATQQQLPKQYRGNPQPDLGLEKALSPIHIKTTNYGTRASTALLMHKDGYFQFAEKDHTPGQNSRVYDFHVAISDT